jgi:hypothetical protein
MPSLKLAEHSAELAEPTMVQRWVLITWPSFLAACLLEALLFSMVDPGEVHWLGHQLEASRQAVYTAAFFCFWLITMASNGLVLWLHKPGRIINAAFDDKPSD